jgi:hypothetical protein
MARKTQETNMKKVRGNIFSDANISRLCEEIAKLDEEIAGRNRVTPTPAKVTPMEPQWDLAHLSETLKTAVREIKTAQQQLAADMIDILRNNYGCSLEEIEKLPGMWQVLDVYKRSLPEDTPNEGKEEVCE